MKVASKLTLGMLLPVSLLLAALLYHTWLVKRLVSDGELVGEIKLEATLISEHLIDLLRDMEQTTNKFFVRFDPVYREILSQQRQRLISLLQDLEALARHQTRTAPSWERRWAMRVLLQIPRQTPELPAVEDQARTELDHLPASERQEQIALAELSDSLDRQAHMAQLALLREQVEEVRSTTLGAIHLQAERSAARGRHAENVSRGVVLAALTSALLMNLVTVSLIQRPLKRLLVGTRAVAAGRFHYQVEVRGNDELASLATSFNDMVRRLGELDRMKKVFLARVSHELKTPLAAMQETNRLLIEGIPGPLTERQQRIISLNLMNGRRLSAMLSKLLDLSRFEVGDLALDLKPRDVAELIRFVLSEQAGRLREKGLAVVERLPEDPPLARCDGDRLLQVIENLLDNALRFSPDGSVLSLGLRWAQKPPRHLPTGWRRKLAPATAGWIHCTVTDMGPGVPDREKEAIFQEFHQVHGGVGQGGLGLGLAICREIMEAHGGCIWVSDAAGGGSSFHLLLPALARPAAEAA